MTYLTKEDWNKYIAPKLNEDQLFHEEFIQVKKVHNILIELINNFFPDINNQMHQYILYSSMIYYYKFILYNEFSHSNISEIKKVLICTSCIFLSCKLLSTLQNSKYLITIDYFSIKILDYLIHKTNRKMTIEEISMIMIEKENAILKAMGLCMGIDNPYEFLSILKLYLQEIHIDNNTINEIIELTNKYNNDSILFPLYLYYTSYEIALSCILLVKENKKYNFIDINNIIKLCKLDIDVNNIYQCSKYISKITEALKSLQKNISDDNLKPISEKNSENYLNFNTISIINTN
jgi:hypothetical protein